jgi:hypothetical protein
MAQGYQAGQFKQRVFPNSTPSELKKSGTGFIGLPHIVMWG